MLAFLISALTTTPSSGISIGLVIGDPTGVSLKFWGVGSNTAFQLHAGGGGFFAPAHIAVSGSILFHTALTRQTPINGYLGIGAYVGMHNRKYGDDYGIMGLQMPFGLEFILREAPLDIFMEVPPIFYFTTDGDVGFGLSMGIGLRFILR